MQVQPGLHAVFAGVPADSLFTKAIHTPTAYGLVNGGDGAKAAAPAFPSAGRKWPGSSHW